MTKEHAQGVFIRFIDFRGELLLRASAIDGVVPSEKNAATYVYLNGTRLTVELPYQTVREIISEAEKARQVNGDEPYIEIICMDSEAGIQKAKGDAMGKEYKTLINKALERFYFRLSASGAHAERAARDSLTRAIRSLYDVAFYADDLDALNELSELICAAECGEHIEPYKLGNIA